MLKIKSLNNKGESLSESLMTMIIVSLGFVMLVTGISTVTRMLRTSDARIDQENMEVNMVNTGDDLVIDQGTRQVIISFGDEFQETKNVKVFKSEKGIIRYETSKK